MKKLLLVAISMALMNVAYADGFAKLRIHISGASNDNRYFLCVGTTGCVSIAAGDKGQTYPMDSGKIEHVYATDIMTLRMSDQVLPKSCQVAVNDNQTLVVTGHITQEGTGSNRAVRITGLNCHLG